MEDPDDIQSEETACAMGSKKKKFLGDWYEKVETFEKTS